MQTNAVALLATLEQDMSTPDADALRRAVKGKRRSEVMKLIKKEADFSQEECAILYEHLKEMVLGKPVALEEVPKAAWAELAAKLVAKYEENDYRITERMMVRLGSKIYDTQPVTINGEVCVYSPTYEPVKLAKLDQIWRIVAK